MPEDKFKKIINEVILRHVDAKKSFVFLFGSRASAKHRPTSDYDIGIYTGEKIPMGIIAGIEGDLEEFPIPVGVDVVDFSRVDGDFKKLAMEKIELWNTPKTNLKLT